MRSVFIAIVCCLFVAAIGTVTTAAERTACAQTVTFELPVFAVVVVPDAPPIATARRSAGILPRVLRATADAVGRYPNHQYDVDVRVGGTHVRVLTRPKLRLIR